MVVPMLAGAVGVLALLCLAQWAASCFAHGELAAAESRAIRAESDLEAERALRRRAEAAVIGLLVGAMDEDDD